MLADGDADAMVTLVRDRKCRIVFGIVTRKDPAGRSLNLPLFSRVSLMRGMKALQLMDVPDQVGFEHLHWINWLPLGCFMRKCRLSESLMGYLNARNGVKAFARVVHVNVRFYRSPDTKPTFRLPPYC